MTMINNNMLANLANITASGIAKLKTFCADLGLSNLTAEGKATAARLSMPNYGAVVDYTGSWGSNITANVDGWVWFTGEISTSSFPTMYMSGMVGINPGATWYPVRAGNAFRIDGGNGNGRQILFYPCIGES